MFVLVISGSVAIANRAHALPVWTEVFALPGLLAIAWNLLSGRSQYGFRQRRPLADWMWGTPKQDDPPPR